MFFFMRKLFILFTFTLSLVSAIAVAQDYEEAEPKNRAVDLKGTHSISLHPGYHDFESQLGYTSGRITAAPHFMGLLSYQYWTENNSALSFSLGILKTETHARYSRTFSKTTIPFLIGYNFYPDGLSWGNVGRGYFGLNAGTYIETNSSVNIDPDNFGAQTNTEVKIGADLHLGLDFYPSKFIRMGPRLAWHSSEYFQGTVVSLTFGVLL